MLESAPNGGTVPGALLRSLMAQPSRTRSQVREAATQHTRCSPRQRMLGHAASEGRSRAAVVHAEATRTVVTLRGETDVSTRAALADVLSRVIAAGNGDVIVDLAAVTFIDTAIVRSLATGQQLPDRTRRTLTFRSPSRPAVRVLDMFGLTELIEPAPAPAVPPHPTAR